MDNNKVDHILKEYVYPNFFTALSHPFTFARILMQLGHEPEPPVLKHTLGSVCGFGSKQLAYPSFFGYCRSISGEVGILGLFTIGMPARLICSTMNLVTTDYMYKKLDYEESKRLNSSSDSGLRDAVEEGMKLSGARIVSVTVSYPFSVIMVRQIASVVGGETHYSNIFKSIQEIWNQEGIPGFFSGLVPRLAGEMITLWITIGFAYVINKYILNDKVEPSIKNYVPTITKIFASSYCYDYDVVCTNMQVSGSRLSVAIPFPSSIECHRYLKSRLALTRGKNVMRRFLPKEK